MAALTELNRPPPFRRTPPANAKLAPLAPALNNDDDDEDWAALEAAAEADAAAQGTRMDLDEGEDVDLDVLREIEAQEREEHLSRLADETTSRADTPGGMMSTRTTTAETGATSVKRTGRVLLEEDDDFGAFGDDGDSSKSPARPRELSRSAVIARQSHSLTRSRSSPTGAASRRSQHLALARLHLSLRFRFEPQPVCRARRIHRSSTDAGHEAGRQEDRAAEEAENRGVEDAQREQGASQRFTPRISAS